jgi:DNA mismatch repair protein MutS
MPEITPMMRQWHRFKREYSDAILFFRAGDFYEMFHEDAVLAARELGITLTSRGREKGKPVPLAGVPYHAMETYLAKLVRKGYKVAICEQVEDPKQAKGVVKREVVRVVTPGTLMEESLLEEKSNNYLAALLVDKSGAGIAYADLSTGEFACGEFSGEEAVEEALNQLVAISPAECLIPESISEELVEKLGKLLRDTFFNRVGDSSFSYSSAKETLAQHFGVASLEGFGVAELTLGIACAGAVLGYLRETQKSALPHITKLRRLAMQEHMLLDAATLRHLEITRNLRDGSAKGTLLEVLDATTTAMGARLLKRWLLHPLTNVNKIRRRLDAVEELYNDYLLREELREALSKVYDLERLNSRIASGSANARDLVALKNSLRAVPEIRELLSQSKSELLNEIVAEMHALEDLVEKIELAIVDEPPASVREGGIIKPGYSEELDRLREAATQGKRWIAELEQREKRRTGIASLKVGYNSVFGYYIQVTKPNLHLVPKDYIRKQTLANAERFVTPELKEKEALILGAEERAAKLEYELFTQLREEAASRVKEVQSTAHALAKLDVLLSFAKVASERSYVKPRVDEGEVIEIKEGRHPVVEAYQREFVPNDAYLDSAKEQILIITGPNMAGKSTYLRQVALIVLLAQVGSFVPAKEARVGVVDRIFTRVGASDDLATGRSTFMVEMQEAANILNNATRRSLVILDEIGRGTSTFDGLSIAWAVVEYIHERIGAKTLFATHYHHLTELEQLLPRIKNYHIAVKEQGSDIIFLRKIMPGSIDKSYGIHVARLAGLPREVIENASQVLRRLEEEEVADDKIVAKRLRKRKLAKVFTDQAQRTLFESLAPKPSPVEEELRKLNPNEMTPLQALETLFKLKEMLRD